MASRDSRSDREIEEEMRQHQADCDALRAEIAQLDKDAQEKFEAIQDMYLKIEELDRKKAKLSCSSSKKK
jgi:hypothetical protein